MADGNGKSSLNLDNMVLELMEKVRKLEESMAYLEKDVEELNTRTQTSARY